MNLSELARASGQMTVTQSPAYFAEMVGRCGLGELYGRFEAAHWTTVHKLCCGGSWFHGCGVPAEKTIQDDYVPVLGPLNTDQMGDFRGLFASCHELLRQERKR